MKRKLDELETWVQRPDRHAAAVSSWSIHKQVEHTALVARQILELVEGLEAGTAGEPTGRLRWPAHAVLAMGWIPRGKGVAPSSVLPGEAPDPAAIRAILDDTRARLRTHAPARGGNRAPHPHFGGMTARQWTRFLGIHTRHHLKIIRDIDRTT